jgi:alkylation response protein AidB-like acyl-CoA dehydrogenase
MTTGSWPAALVEVPAALAPVRDRLRDFLREELIPRERERGVEEEAQADGDLRRWVRTRSEEQGLFRLLQPADLGGGALGPAGRVVLREEIAASNAVLGRFVLGGDGGLLRHGNAEQRERLLAPVLRGERTAALAFTDAREGPRTTATRRGVHFLVSGVKAFVTGGTHADLLLVVARVTENAGGPTGTAILVVPRDGPDVRLRRELRTLDGAVHGEFELLEVAVPERDVLGTIGAGLPLAFGDITAMRLDVAAAACGVGRRALDLAIGQATRPHRSGAPLAERQQVQTMIADSAADLLGARAAVYTAARHAEAGMAVESEVAMAKILATEAVARIVDRAIQLTGGAAVVEGHPLARLYRLVRSWRIAEGTSEVLRLTVGRSLLGLAPARGATVPRGTPEAGPV